MTKVTNGVYLFDMGVNFAGWIRIQGIGFEGMELRIRYGERLRNDQDLLYGNYHQVICIAFRKTGLSVAKTDIISGKPRFTNHGFRYVEISGMSHPMKEEDVMGIRVNTAFRQMGNFSCDNQLLNQFHKMADNSFLSNMQGIPMDCPIRERCGWGGDAIVIAESLLYNYSAKEFLRKFVWDMISSRLVFGEWKNVAPGRRGSGKACAAWGSAVVTIAWDCYWFSGDKAMLQDVYPYMKLWVDELANQAESYIIKEGLDDWAQPDERKLKGLSTSAQISTAYYYLSAKLLSESAGELGYEQDKENYRLLSEEIKKALKEKYYKNGTFGGQGIDAMAVCEDLLDEDEVQRYHKKTGRGYS